MSYLRMMALLLLLGNTARAMDVSIDASMASLEERLLIERMMIENPKKVIMESAIILKLSPLEESDIIKTKYCCGWNEKKVLRGVLKQGLTITTSTTQYIIARTYNLTRDEGEL